MLKRVRLAAVCCALLLVALLVGGCGGALLQAEGTGGILEGPAITQVTAIRVSSDATALTIIPVPPRKPYTIRIAQTITQDGEKHLTAFVDGAKVVDLSGPRLEPLVKPELANQSLRAQDLHNLISLINKASVGFIIACAEAIPGVFSSSGFDKDKAISQCVSDGVISIGVILIVEGIDSPRLIPILVPVMKVLVKELITVFGPTVWSRIKSLYQALTQGYQQIWKAIYDAALRILAKPGQNSKHGAIAITSIKQDSPGPLEIGAGVFIEIDFSGPDEDSYQALIERWSGESQSWMYETKWQTYDYSAERGSGQFNIPIIACSNPGIAKFRAQVGDGKGYWSEKKEFKMLCI